MRSQHLKMKNTDNQYNHQYFTVLDIHLVSSYNYLMSQIKLQ